MTDLFQKPFVFESDGFNVIGVNPEALKSRVAAGLSWADFLHDLSQMFGGRSFCSESIMYSTVSNPHKYANVFTEKTLALLQSYLAAQADVARLQSEHDAIESQRPPEVVPEPQYDEDGELIEPKPKKKKEIRAEKEARRIDVDRYQALISAQHAVSCLEVRVANVLLLAAIRVEMLQ